MIYLVVDIGNTKHKIALYNNSELVELHTLDSFPEQLLDDILKKYKIIDAAIISSTAQQTKSIVTMLEGRGVVKVVDFNHLTPLPIINKYHTPLTVGLDRLASAVAANQKFKEKELIIFDLGTAITIDYVNKEGEFIGGNISPGLEMRFKALNHFTRRLPLISKEEQMSLYLENYQNNITNNRFGQTTQSAIFCGVVEGICNEIKGYLHENSEKVPFFTGGDALFFEKLIKIPIFVNSQSTLFGLKTIIQRLCIEKL